MSFPIALPTTGPSADACCAPATGLDPRLDADGMAAVAKALAEPIRVNILDVLRRHGEPLCQCELRPLFGIAQPLLSHHINKLVDAGLVEVERRHRWAYYSVRPDALKELTTWLS
jgi:ArsR family transcriptional regulator, arsenate/arsenite/antimonite-responsive transcriptional repressor